MWPKKSTSQHRLPKGGAGGSRPNLYGWGHLHELVFLLALSFGARIEDAEEVWVRIQDQPMVDSLPEMAELVARAHIELLEERMTDWDY